MPEIRVQDEQGNIHVFPDGSTPQMIAQAMGVVPPDMPTMQARPPLSTISAAPTGALPWLRNAEGDLRYGTQTTGLGQFLHKLGYTGGETMEDAGHTNAVGRIADSVPVGLSELAQGAVNNFQGAWRNDPKQLWEGTKKGLQGAADVAAIPSMVATPQAAEELSNLPSFLRNLLPNTRRAGANFDAVMNAARNAPVDVGDAGNVALRSQELASRGGRQPKVISDFLRRTTDPTKGPLTYEESRDFASNAGELSAEESMALKPKQRRLVGNLGKQLDRANAAAAQQAGVGDQYSSAMREYRQAKTLEDFKDMLKGSAVQAAKQAVPTAVGAAAAGYAAKKVLGKK